MPEHADTGVQRIVQCSLRMDVEKEGRDFVIGSLVGTPRQDVFVPWQRLTLDCLRGS